MKRIHALTASLFMVCVVAALAHFLSIPRESGGDNLLARIEEASKDVESARSLSRELRDKGLFREATVCLNSASKAHPSNARLLAASMENQLIWAGVYDSDGNLYMGDEIKKSWIDTVYEHEDRIDKALDYAFELAKCPMPTGAH